MNKLWCRGILGLILALPVSAFALQAPAGVRPCCAFGTDLKAQVGGIPVPFFALENLLEPGEIGHHSYNDGSQGVAGSLLGIADEKNGLIYTLKGGFIDTAHVRDTADYTFYLYHEIWPYIGSDHELTLPPELRLRKVVLTADEVMHSSEQKRAEGIKLAGMLAFQLAQWHEIAQWFGLKSVSGWSELASAFSPEDLYSNMLGARLAMQVLSNQPGLSVSQFSQAFEQALAQELSRLGAQSKAETQKQINALDGTWWDSNQRLPEKWVLRQRDYHLGMRLLPHGAKQAAGQSIAASRFGQLQLLPAGEESAFSSLPESLRNMPVWRAGDFQTLANFARQQDLLLRPDAEVTAD
ncbi:DUF4056 domain-containing protein [Shewanella sp. GXUN23E]|uniref:DUF4056 domain-containing protein n=1 Tax=Shewanella sp. GXUN23E TaxID=3422498 RepID=UPI003D7EE4AD